ncbi:hypothetical protein CL654_02350 [bacterium]|nr:hypothetical protein [bacterium]|tara:strand:+ start:17978 stop:19099 length:1122 start_codon:yes stop_codon:yes gene_type:complete
MTELPNLEILAKRLGAVDETILAIFARRMELAAQVERYKRSQGQPIIREEIEDARVMKAAQEWAKKYGVRSHFAGALMYFSILQSCHEQLRLLQGDHSLEKTPRDRKQALLDLTERVAPWYEEKFLGGTFSTDSYLRFEREVLDRIVENMSKDERERALDLGCATGIQAARLAARFDRVVGYDISPHMIREAKKKSIGNAEFFVHDLDEGNLSFPQTSVSFAALSMGTGSDIREIRKLLANLHDVLSPGGKLFASFYNLDALVYKQFLPWPLGLAAQINLDEECLDVHLDTETGPEVFSVFARPYTFADVESMVSDQHFVIDEMYTYPTVSSVLPGNLLVEGLLGEEIEKIDRGLSNEGNEHGAYTIVVATRV